MTDCNHCRQRPATRSRGLCSTCYYAPGVRERYPMKDSNRNVRQSDPTPTEIAERCLEIRAAKGELPR